MRGRSSAGAARHRRSAALALAFAGVLAARAVAAEGPTAGDAPATRSMPVAAVLDLQSATIEPDELDALSQALWQALLNRGAAALLPRRETRVWLIENDLFPYAPYRTDLPLDRVGRALRADFVLTGRVDRMGDRWVLALTLTDVAAAAARPIEGMPMTGEAAALTAALVDAAGRVAAALDGARGRRNAPPEGTGSAAPATVKTAPSDLKQRLAEDEPLTTAPTTGRPLGPAAQPAAAATPSTTTVERATTAIAATTSSGRPAAGESVLTRLQRLPAGSAERLAALEAAAAAAPEDRAIGLLLAREYYDRRRYEQCLAQCDRMLAGGPDADALVLRAAAHYARGAWDAAARDNEAALAIAPDNLWARYNLALALTAAGSTRAAEAWRAYVERAAGDPAHAALVEDARRRLNGLQEGARDGTR